jgi:hypothetical protein
MFRRTLRDDITIPFKRVPLGNFRNNTEQVSFTSKPLQWINHYKARRSTVRLSHKNIMRRGINRDFALSHLHESFIEKVKAGFSNTLR